MSIPIKRSFSWLRGCLWIGVLFATLNGGALLAESQPTPVFGAALPGLSLNLGQNPGGKPMDVDLGIQVLFIITLLSLAPSILLLMTSFTRIVIVLSFIRSALSLQGAPSNQIIIGLSFFVTLFVMSPTWAKIQRDVIAPYSSEQMTGSDALEGTSKLIKQFMLKQTRAEDLELFASMAGSGSATPTDLPLNVVIPGFVISELRTAFQMGFLLFVPFIMIDLVVATVLMSMGMMMMPPVTVSLPLKILLFVLVDGWSLIIRSLVESFTT